MSRSPLAIPKESSLKPPQDYYRLRREGIGFIEQMASQLWTDYNTHDPGITILEGLCYVITELAYRIGWDIKDLLTPATPSADPDQPYPDQAFFTAREILTINPVTPEDFRRVLIGLDTVRNAWVLCKECACDVRYYAWCDEDTLRFSFRKPATTLPQVKKIDVLGLYEVLLELEADAESGDLNDRKIELIPNLTDADGHSYSPKMEVRFPKWELERPEDWKIFLESADTFSVRLLSLGATRTYDVLSDPGLDEAGRNQYLRTHWNHTLYANFEISLSPSAALPTGATIAINNAALHLFGGNSIKSRTDLKSVKTVVEDSSAAGFIQRYRTKSRKVAAAVVNATRVLAAHRNLDEDYCSVKGVEIEDIAVCADIEVAPDADIERVQAQAWFQIEQYFNPPVPHYSLQEMMASGVPVEEIFNGPASDNGFIKADDLAAAGLKTVLRSSDIINRLMDIEGVVAIGSLLLSKYDAQGNIVSGAADPALNNGVLVFDPAKTSSAWQLYVSELHQPRLYFNQSRFLFYKNGVPFLPGMDEAADTLIQLRGEAERPKISNVPADLPVPAGAFRHPQDYYPLQYSFPLTYGIGPVGLPSHASALRRAQAKQLQAYLMVFEQLLANSYAQVAHTADLFSLDPDVSRTYFAHKLSAAQIKSYDDVVNGITESELGGMIESTQEFHERRNRFLDHVIARFGESFGEYALLATSLYGEQSGLDRLIADKISFLKAYPLISRDRAKAFDYTRLPCAPENMPGLRTRISRLLGYPDLVFSWTLSVPATVTHYTLRDKNENIWIEGAFPVPIAAHDDDSAMQLAFDTMIVRMTQADAYDIVAENGQFRLNLKDNGADPLGGSSELFATAAGAQETLSDLISWSSNERAVVVEHLLLRPKFAGDALFPACPAGGCNSCDDADPYSFRLSFVMPGWTAPFNADLALRGFAERTIQQETPSHLLMKIFWVGNDGFIENPCDPVIADLAALLETTGLTGDGNRPDPNDACRCANSIYAAFSAVFKIWYEDKTLDYWHADALRAALDAEFSAQLSPSLISCTTVLNAALFAELQAIMVNYFHAIALDGWQFERFENAWSAWLDANAGFDWLAERLQERVEAMLSAGLIDSAAGGVSGAHTLCMCAADIVTVRGMAFYDWMEMNIKAGNRLEDFTAFAPDPVVLCAGIDFKPETAANIEALLKDRYAAYKEVSYRLRMVVNLLGKLNNTYPGATLHDCDEGSDLNPVRLGSTALGNYPFKKMGQTQ